MNTIFLLVNRTGGYFLVAGSMMKAVSFIFLLVVAFVCDAEDFSEEEFLQQMEANNRIMRNGMSYQVLQRCGADADTLSAIKIYLYNDINDALKHYPKAKVDIDGVFGIGMESGNEFYEIGKDNPGFCEAYLKEAKVYIAK